MTNINQNTAPKLVTVKNVLTQLVKAEYLRRDVTIAALYHTMVHGNIAWAEQFTREHAALLDGALRQVFPIVWDKGNESKGMKAHYRLAKIEKRDQMRAEFGATREMSWEDFYELALAYWMKHEKEQKRKELSADDMKDAAIKGMARAITKWAEMGMAYDDILVMVERARKGLDIVPKVVTTGKDAAKALAEKEAA